MSKKHTIPVCIIKNQLKTCSVPGCGLNRHRIAAHCELHARNRHLYGHPQGSRLYPKNYAMEKQEVSSFIEKHRAHPGIVSAVSWLQEWMDQACLGNQEAPGWSDMLRLSSKGATALEVLEEAAAVWLYHSRHPGKFPDGLSLSFGLAIAVLHLRPLDHRKPYGAKRSLPVRLSIPTRKDVGARLKGHLAPLFINIITGIEAQEEQQRQALRVLSQPFNSLINQAV